MLKATDLPKPGERIVLVESPDPPMPIGARGTVRATSWHPAGDASWAEIRVDWDGTDKTIGLVCPPDRYEVVADELTLPDGRRGILTTDHAQSCHGRPVLVVDGQAIGAGETGPLRADSETLRLQAHRAGYVVQGVTCDACGGLVGDCECERIGDDDLLDDLGIER